MDKGGRGVPGPTRGLFDGVRSAFGFAIPTTWQPSNCTVVHRVHPTELMDSAHYRAPTRPARYHCA